MTSFPLRIPDDLKAEATRLADVAGVSLNQYVVTALASRVGAQVEAERYFVARSARTVPGRAKEVLSRSGRGTRHGRMTGWSEVVAVFGRGGDQVA